MTPIGDCSTVRKSMDTEDSEEVGGEQAKRDSKSFRPSAFNADYVAIVI